MKLIRNGNEFGQKISLKLMYRDRQLNIDGGKKVYVLQNPGQKIFEWLLLLDLPLNKGKRKFHGSVNPFLRNSTFRS
jgi:hypothetical protein